MQFIQYEKSCQQNHELPVNFWAYIIQLKYQLYLWYIQSFLVLSEVICIALHEASFLRPLYK